MKKINEKLNHAKKQFESVKGWCYGIVEVKGN